MKATLIILSICLSSIVYSQNKKIVSGSQDCSAELNVEKNRNTRSANEDGANFTLILKNTSSFTTTYDLSTMNLSVPCNNNVDQKSNGLKTSNTNVVLDVSLQTDDIDNQARKKLGKTEITLAGGQSYKFKVNVNVPKGTPYFTWSCIEVEAKSTSCSSSSAKTILSVYVPDPSEE